MNGKAETNRSPMVDSLLLFVSVVLLIGGIGAYYFYEGMAIAPVRVAGLIVVTLIAAWIAAQSEQGATFFRFLKESLEGFPHVGGLRGGELLFHGGDKLLNAIFHDVQATRFEGVPASQLSRFWTTPASRRWRDSRESQAVCGVMMRLWSARSGAKRG